jgi:glycosyltransferase involved in cell wall biosynthesis
MISILIPCYDYSVYNLICELKNQCDTLAVEYEIICQDDASGSEFNCENEKINTLHNCFFYSNTENLGRGKNRNSLAKKSKYNWLLFLDCDTKPTTALFIQNYLKAIENKEISVIFGGLAYEAIRPQSNQLLRWLYGKKRESIDYLERKKNPYATTLTSNLLIKKSVFEQILFSNSITQYGYEDALFVSDLKKQSILIEHIDNGVFHLNLETSLLFLEKTKVALDNLIDLSIQGNFSANESKLLTQYYRLKKLGLVTITGRLFSVFESILRFNLVSKYPQLVLFDVYKLGYFCQKSLSL